MIYETLTYALLDGHRCKICSILCQFLFMYQVVYIDELQYVSDFGFMLYYNIYDISFQNPAYEIEQYDERVELE